MDKELRVIISGGGTGGHIFPAVSIANALRELCPGVKILFVGAEGRMEMQRVPAAGYEIKGLPICGFDRKHILNNIKTLFKIMRSRSLAKRIIKEFRPMVAVGVGGYASGPTLDEAQAMGIPTLIQEQNSYAGVTNKLLAKKADKICVAYDGMERFFPKDKIILTGNPVRQSLLNCKLSREDAIKTFGLDPAKKTIMIIGGSLGARTMNEAVLNNLVLIKQSGAQFVWQTGKYYSAHVQEELAKRGKPENLAVMEFILVPSPNVAEDHQTKNTLALTTRDAALYVKDADAVRTLIPRALNAVADDALLASLGKNIKALALPDSAKIIAKEVMALAWK